MNKKYLKGLCLLALSSCAYSKASVAYADVLEGIVNADVLNVRAEPNTSSSIVGQLNKNTKVEILDEDSNWYKINFNGKNCWVSKDFISVNQSSTTEGQVTASSLNVRDGASTSNNIIGSLNNGTKVTIISKDNNWYKIKYQNGYGWVSADYIVTTGSENNNGNNNNDNSSSINKKYLVTADALNVRSGPGTSYGVITTVSYNTVVTASESRAGWTKISANGTSGWVSNDYLSEVTETNPTPTPPPTDNNGSAVNKDGIVTADVLNVRSGAGTNYAVIDALSKNTKVTVVEESNGWCKIKLGNSYGWASSDYISFDINGSGNDGNNGNPGTTNPTPDSVIGKVAVVNASSLNLRSGAGTQYGIVKVLNYGNQLDIIDNSNGWIKVNASGSTGWVSTDYVTIYDKGSVPSGPNVPETPPVTSGYTGQDIVNLAKKYLGVPYVWGGTTPSGFDCSGLVQYVYKEIGVYLPRVTYDQVNVGQTVSRNDLQPGDLIFFTSEGNPSDIGHVGIYAGNNEFIHAPAPGSVVKYSSLSNVYYNKQYYTAKRVLK